MEHEISIGDINISVDKNSNILSLIKEISDRFNDTSPEIRCLYHLGSISFYLHVNTEIVKKNPFQEMGIFYFNENKYFEKQVDYFKDLNFTKYLEYDNNLNITPIHLYNSDKEIYISLVKYHEKLNKQFSEKKNTGLLMAVSIVLVISLIPFLILKIN